MGAVLLGDLYWKLSHLLDTGYDLHLFTARLHTIALKSFVEKFCQYVASHLIVQNATIKKFNGKLSDPDMHILQYYNGS